MANINDKITKTMDTVNPVVTTVFPAKAPGASSISGVSLEGWTEETAVHFSTFGVDTNNKIIPGTQIDWKGIANRATNTINNLERVGGMPDDGVPADYVIQAGPTPSWANDLAEGLLTTLNPNGTLKNGIVTASKIGDGQVPASKIDFSTLNSDIGSANIVTITGTGTNVNFGTAQTFNVKKDQVIEIICTRIGNSSTTPWSVGVALSGTASLDSSPTFNDTAATLAGDGRVSNVTVIKATSDGTVIIQPQYVKTTSGTIYCRVQHILRG